MYGLKSNHNGAAEGRLLMVASDRISAFDCVLPAGIPNKGRVLNKLSAFWFGLTSDIVPNHLISADWPEIAREAGLARIDLPIVSGRSL